MNKKQSTINNKKNKLTKSNAKKSTTKINTKTNSITKKSSEKLIKKENTESNKKATLIVSKETKKETKKNLVQPTTIILIILGLVLVFFALNTFFAEDYKFSFTINEVKFVSNEFTPSAFFKEFKQNDSFLLIIDLKENNSNAWMVNAMNLWLVALNADKKQVNLIVKSTNNEGIITACHTNEGNTNEEKELTLSECEEVINSNTPKIFVELKEKDLVLMQKNELRIISSSEKTITQNNFVAIKEMYNNFEDILNKVNQLVGMVV